MGRVAIEAGDSVIDDNSFGGRQARLVFALLVAERAHAVSRSELADALWPDELPKAWESALRSLVSKVRSVLTGTGELGGEALEAAFGCYQMHLPPDTLVDIELAVSAAAGAATALEQGDIAKARDQALAATSIVAQSFLPGEDGQWVARVRERLSAVRLRSLEILSSALSREGRTPLAVEAAEEALSLDPYRESAHRALIAAHRAGGNRAEALRAYERCRRLLAEELGVAPSPETEAAYLGLLGEEPAAVAGGGSGDPTGPPTVRLPFPPALGINRPAAFVGRRRTLDRIRVEFDEATTHQRRVVLLTGEAGVGKTAVAREAATMLHEEGAVVLYGRCDEERIVLYQPFVEAIEQYVVESSSESLREHIGPNGRLLARLVPAVAHRFPEMAPAPLDDVAMERHLLFNAVGSFLTSIARVTPLVLVVGDLHFAGAPTVGLLRYLTRSSPPCALLIIGTYREEEPYAPSDAGEFISDLELEPNVERMRLGGLDEEDVGVLVRGVLGAEATPAQLAATIHEQTGGNAFLVNEVVRHLQDGIPPTLDGAASESLIGPVPEAVTDTILRRRAQLRESTNKVLDVASVLGRHFDVAVLEQMARLDEDTLLDALDEATASRFLTEVPASAERFSFTHGLVRHAIYGRLSAIRRARYHARAGEILAGLNEGDPARLAQLAHHFAMAGPRYEDRAVILAVAAGDEAARRLGYERAVEHFQWALGHGLQAPEEAVERCRVLMALAAAQRRSGNMAAARDAYMEATKLARRVDDPRALALCADALASGGEGVSAWITDEVRVSLLEEALAVLGPDDAELRVRILAELATALYYFDQQQRQDDLAREALAIARRIDRPGALAVALGARRAVAAGPHNTELRLMYTQEIVSLGEQAGEHDLSVRGRLARLPDLVEVGDTELFHDEVAALVDACAGLHEPYLLWRALSWSATAALIAGQAAVAEARAVDAMAVWRGEPHPDAVRWRQLLRSTLDTADGRWDDAAESLRSLADALPLVPAYRCLEAASLARAGRHEEARVEFERFAADGFSIPRLDGHWLAAACALAETCAALGDVTRARSLYDLLSPFAGRLAVLDGCGGGGHFSGSVAYPLALLASVLGRDAECRRHREAGAAANHRFGAGRPWSTLAPAAVARNARSGRPVRRGAALASAPVEHLAPTSSR